MKNNNLKEEVKQIKKEKKKMSINHKLATNRSNPRSMKNVRGLSETEGSDISAQDFSKKTFDQ